MAPTQPQSAVVADHNGQPTQSERSMSAFQPMAAEPMNPERPHADTQSNQVGMRGGEMCPGRFCFCVPCPIPCDFCII